MKDTRAKRLPNSGSFKPGQITNPKGRKPLTEAQRLAREMRGEVQPEVVQFLINVMQGVVEADLKERLVAARALLEELPPDAESTDVELTDEERIARVITIFDAARERRATETLASESQKVGPD